MWRWWDRNERRYHAVTFWTIMWILCWLFHWKFQLLYIGISQNYKAGSYKYNCRIMYIIHVWCIQNKPTVFPFFPYAKLQSRVDSHSQYQSDRSTMWLCSSRHLWVAVFYCLCCICDARNFVETRGPDDARSREFFFVKTSKIKSRF